MRILVASSSVFRQSTYREALENLGHTVTLASGGAECADVLRRSVPDVLVLEAPLLWGGSEGVLEVAQGELACTTLPVIVVAVGAGSIDWFQLSRYRIDDILFRIPTVRELGRAIARVTEQGEAPGDPKERSSADPGGAACETAASLGSPPPAGGWSPRATQPAGPLASK
jgi:two-component system capsular synthesis sensor histidine kinase RcsC